MSPKQKPKGPAINEVQQQDSVASTNQDSTLGQIAFLLVAIVIAGTCLHFLTRSSMQYRSSAFPSVWGQMTEYSWDDFGTAGESTLVVAYNYTVDGQRYFGNRKRFAWRQFGSESNEAKALARSWGKGNQVKVFYDPQNPANSALDNLYTPGDWKTLTLAIGVLIVASLIIIVFSIELGRKALHRLAAPPPCVPDLQTTPVDRFPAS